MPYFFDWIKPRSRREKKFYFLSLLCLIPGFGLIIGLVFIIVAIFDFKSKRLLIIVLLCMLGGYIVYRVDYYYLENHVMYSEETADHFSILAADDLDEISNKLETYKQREGSYPENLEILKKAYPKIRITDPLLERNPKIHKFLGYYYKQNGFGYILFSSGKDCIPNTADDIYPRHALKPSN